MKKNALTISKVSLVISILIMLGLTLTNPSLKDFKEFCPDKSSLLVGFIDDNCFEVNVQIGYRRLENNILFSYYKFSYTYLGDCSNKSYDRYYIGIFSNFYEINQFDADYKGLSKK